MWVDQGETDICYWYPTVNISDCCDVLGGHTPVMEPVTCLVFVGRVEGDLSYFLVPVPHRPDRATGQLDTLQQGRL